MGCPCCVPWGCGIGNRLAETFSTVPESMIRHKMIRVSFVTLKLLFTHGTDPQAHQNVFIVLVFETWFN
jgi:hypothetical protein